MERIKYLMFSLSFTSPKRSARPAKAVKVSTPRGEIYWLRSSCSIALSPGVRSKRFFCPSFLPILFQFARTHCPFVFAFSLNDCMDNGDGKAGNFPEHRFRVICVIFANAKDGTCVCVCWCVRACDIHLFSTVYLSPILSSRPESVGGPFCRCPPQNATEI